VRGSPLLRALVAFLAILSLGFPLWRLTRAAESVPVEAKPSAPATVREITLQLTFTAPPKNFRVSHLGQVVWSEAAPMEEMERKLQLVFPKEGIDLRFEAEFPEGTRRVALRAKLTDPAGNEVEKSLWGDAGIDEVLTFP
jgi:hypothetical protein